MIQSAPLSSGFFGLNPFSVLVSDLMKMFKDDIKSKDLEEVWYQKVWGSKTISCSLRQVLVLDVSCLSGEERMYLIKDLELILGSMAKSHLLGYTFHDGYVLERNLLVAHGVSSIKSHEEVCRAFNAYIQKRMNDFIDSTGNQRLFVLHEEIKIPSHLFK